MSYQKKFGTTLARIWRHDVVQNYKMQSSSVSFINITGIRTLVVLLTQSCDTVIITFLDFTSKLKGYNIY